LRENQPLAATADALASRQKIPTKMNVLLTTMLGFALLLIAGCERRGEVAATPPPEAASQLGSSPGRATAPEVPGVSGLEPPTHRERRVTRTIDKDADGDGIAERRVVITETYDDAGILLERIREQDFQADGIVDQRTVTRFDDSTDPDM
jgi:hypothetical protein